MGDATFRINEFSFSTGFGWVTLIYWCFGLSHACLELTEKESYVMRFSESEDFVSFRRQQESVLVACSYRPGIAVVKFKTFAEAVRDFAKDRFQWILTNYPEAFANPAMTAGFQRVGIAFRPKAGGAPSR